MPDLQKNPDAQRGDSVPESASLAVAKGTTRNALSSLSEAMIPQNFDQLERFADTVARSKMVPKQFRGRPQDITVAVMHGLEIGLKPLQALQNIAVINGKPSIYGDAAIAIVRQSPACEWIKEWIDSEGDAMVAYCESKRRGEPEPSTQSFGVADARRASLWGRRGPWSDYPQRMLQMRARSWLLRDLYADVLAGLYIAEEAQDIPTDGGSTRKSAFAEPKREPPTAKQARLVKRLAKSSVWSDKERTGIKDRLDRYDKERVSTMIDTMLDEIETRKAQEDATGADAEDDVEEDAPETPNDEDGGDEADEAEVKDVEVEESTPEPAEEDGQASFPAAEKLFSDPTPSHQDPA